MSAEEEPIKEIVTDDRTRSSDRPSDQEPDGRVIIQSPKTVKINFDWVLESILVFGLN